MPELCLRPKLALLLGSLCDPYIEGDVDCEVGMWTTWNRHYNSGCEEKRRRYVKKFNRGEGNPCPPLEETRQCVSSTHSVTTFTGNSTSDAFNTLNAGLGGFGNGTSRRRRRENCQVQCPPDRDIVIVVDSSGSVGEANFTTACKDLGRLIPYLCGLQPDYITKCDSTRLALVTYGQIPNLVFDLNDCRSRHRCHANVQNDINQARYLSSLDWATATGDALQFTADRVLNKSHGMRKYSKKTILLLTDGKSNHGSNPVTVASKLFKKYEGKLAIIAVGIGDKINYQELVNITKHQNLENPLLILGSYHDFTTIVDYILGLLKNGAGICESDILDKKKRK
jgi:uncharacterized protein YegL